MQNIKKATIFLVALILASGCAKHVSPKVSDDCLINGEASPVWVCEPFIDKESYAVTGEAKRSNHADYQSLRERALADAHKKLQSLAGKHSDISFTKEVDIWISKEGDMYLLVGIPKRLASD
jgi:hypothetical protein